MDVYVKLALAIISLIIFAMKSFGQAQPPINEVKWSFQFAHGTLEGCSSSNVDVLFAGNDASVLFQDMAASFRIDSNQALYKKVVCFLSFTVRLTRARALLSFRSTLTGSVLKDVGTTGSMRLLHAFKDPTTNSYLVTPGGQKEVGAYVPFAANVDVIPLTEAPFNYTFTGLERQQICQKSKANGYLLNLIYSVELISQRQTPAQMSDVTAYSIDSSVAVQDCPRHGRRF